MKNKILLVCSIVLVIVSLCILLYPSFSNYINSMCSKRAIDSYSEEVDSLDTETKDKMFLDAENYNEQLKNQGDVSGYDDVLGFSNKALGYLEIPKINLYLPIYHGSGEDVLSIGVGHLPDTALPIGGKGNHCVLAAHTGYVGRIFFDNIGELTPGDLIYVNILDTTLVYNVTNQRIVNSNDTSYSQAIKDKDLISLVTCYPYGKNTHRLIVTGERNSSTEN